MGGATSRRKGHQFERNTAIALRHLFPEARRHLEYQDGEANGVDISNTGIYRVQCKKLRAYVSVNTINEIQCDRGLGEVPILVTAADNKPAMAVVYFEDLVTLLERVEK